jgi:hypothetical protein
VAGTHDCGNEPSGSIKCGELQLLMKKEYYLDHQVHNILTITVLYNTDLLLIYCAYDALNNKLNKVPLLTPPCCYLVQTLMTKLVIDFIFHTEE